MNHEQEHVFEPTPQGHSRFFSGGHLDELKKRLDGDIVNFERLYIRSTEKPEKNLKNSARYICIREDSARKQKEEFSEKVVISGVVPDERIMMTGSMGDEVEYIEGPCPIDMVFLVSGNYEQHLIINISRKILG